MVLARYVLRRGATTFLAVLAGSLSVVLGVEFADRARFYTGEGWVAEVVRLYACKAAVMGYQLAPAALCIAAALCVAAFKRNGEVTAMRALGFSPAILIGPIAALGLVATAALVVADETALGGAVRRIDDIQAGRFGIWADWNTWYLPRRWFRSDHAVYFMREVAPDGSYAGASVFELTADFRLRRRVDAASMRPSSGGRWEVSGAQVRSFADDGTSTLETIGRGEMSLSTPARPFSVRSGRPEEMGIAELLREINVRREVGLPQSAYVIAWHSKLAHPLMCLPLAVLGVGLSLRPRRRDAAAVAMVEGLGAVAAVWALNVVARAAALSGRLSPSIAPWLVLALAAVAAAILARRSFAR